MYLYLSFCLLIHLFIYVFTGESNKMMVQHKTLKNVIWLVVSTPLKNMIVNWDDYGKMKNAPNHQPVMVDPHFPYHLVIFFQRNASTPSAPSGSETISTIPSKPKHMGTADSPSFTSGKKVVAQNYQVSSGDLPNLVMTFTVC